MPYQVVAVFHGEQMIVSGEIPEIASNPPMTISGMKNIQRLVPEIEELGPYEGMFCSRVACTLDAASVLALALDLDFGTMAELGQCANDGIYYPGHEDDDMKGWQADGLEAFRRIHEEWVNSDGRDDERFLVVSNRAIIGGVVAHIKGIRDENGIRDIATGVNLAPKGFIVFEVNDKGKISLAE